MSTRPIQEYCSNTSVFVKVLLLILLVTIISVIAFLISLLITREQNAEQTCITEHCARASARIQAHLNPAVNPCNDNFENFVCHNMNVTIKQQESSGNHLIPSNPLNWLTIGERISQDDSNSLVLLKLFYRSCMDVRRIEQDRDTTILDIIHKLGDWPIANQSSWNEDSFNWIDLMIKCRHMGVKFEWFLEFNVVRNGQNYTPHSDILEISIPKYLREIPSRIHSEYRELMKDIAASMGHALRGIAHYEIDRLLAFENDLGLLATEHRKKTTSKQQQQIKIVDLQKLWPTISWLDLLNNVTVIDEQFSEDDYVAFDILDYLKELNKLLLETRKRIVMDFIVWKLLEFYSNYLTKPHRTRFETYNLLISSNRIVSNRTEFCMNEANKLFPDVAEAAFIRKNVDAETNLSIRNIFDRIKEEFEQRIYDDTQVKEKFQKMTVVVGGQNEIFNETYFDQYTGTYGLRFSSLNVIKILNERNLRLYDRKFRSIFSDLGFNATGSKIITNINFTIINNIMTIPVSLIKSSFNRNLPNYSNYATLGVLIAHQIAWEYRGWLDKIKPKCSHHGLSKLEGYIKLQLAAADIAYNAYDRQSIKIKLPELNYLPRQLFWIETGQFMCKNRLDGSKYFTYLPKFLTDFNCPANLSIAPPHRLANDDDDCVT